MTTAADGSACTMMRVRLPYHRGYEEADVPAHRVRAVLEPSSFPGGAGTPPSRGGQVRCVNSALDHPIGAPCLETMATGKKTATIIVSDHTRPVPSQLTLPLLLDRLRRGNPGIAITILVATGCHRATRDMELRGKLGDQICDTERVVVHDCEDHVRLAFVGTLPSGGALWLNRLALETELLVAEGFIEPHFFAGFSGGRKSVLPGVAGRQTVLANHCSRFIADSRSRAGNLKGNPVHLDMVWAARQAHLAFILNVTLNPDKTISAAFAGHPEKAHIAGCAFMKHRVSVEVVPTEIVITSNGGYPLDQNIYQAVKGMATAEGCCKEGGTIIMVAGCGDGHGGEEFFRAMTGADSPQALFDQVRKIPQEETRPDQWQYQILARILSRHRVILVTRHSDARIVRSMKMEHAETLQEAIKMAMHTASQGAGITVIPDGVGMIVKALAWRCCGKPRVLPAR